MSYRAPIAAERVALAPQPQLGLRNARWGDQTAGADQRERQPRLLSQRRRWRLEGVDNPQRSVHVVHLDQARDVRTPEPQLTRRAQYMDKRLRRAERQRRGARLSRLHPAPVPEPQPERAAWQRRLELTT